MSAVEGLACRVSGFGCRVSGCLMTRFCPESDVYRLHCGVQGFGFRVSGFGSRISDPGFQGSIQGPGERRVQVAPRHREGFGRRGVRVKHETGFGMQDLVFRVSGSGFRVSGFGFRVSGFGFRVSGAYRGEHARGAVLHLIQRGAR
jgi:hypothetical protein